MDEVITAMDVVIKYNISYQTLNHYTNFQPLCSKINRDIKRDNK